MMLDFRKALFPTEEEKLAQRELISKIIKQEEDYLLSQGLSLDEIGVINKIEEDETKSLHPYQVWSPRTSLLQNNIITVEVIKNEIQEYLGGKL